MARWAAFAGITVAVLAILLVLARTSQAVLSDAMDASDASDVTRELDSADGGPEGRNDSSNVSSPPKRQSDQLDQSGPSDRYGQSGSSGQYGQSGSSGQYGQSSSPGPGPPGPGPGEDDWPTRLLLINVALSQGILGAILLGGAWYARIPGTALGITADPLGAETQVAIGVGFGVAIAVANTLGASAADAFGFEAGEELRELLAPESGTDWAFLLVVVLPVIAGFEELLFRGALVGAFSVGFGLSPWVLAALSSVAFAVGHGAQGTVGIVVTGLLGFVLAAGFVLTGSLLVVVVAHYLVNATEFVVFEGFGLDPPGR